MSPAKKSPKSPKDKKKSGGRPLSEAELRKVSGGAEPVSAPKKPVTRAQPVND